MTLFISCPAILLLHFILSLFLSRSFFYRFLRFSFTCIVSILCLAPHLNSDNLCSLFSSGPFLLFLRVSGANYFFFVLLLSLFFGPFHLHRATIFSLVSFFFPVHPLLLIRANLFSLCLSPPRSFHLFPFPAPFIVLCGFSSVSCHAMYIKNICIPASFPFRSGRVPVPFPFRFLFVLAAFWSRLLFVSFSFRPRSGPVFFSFRWRLLLSPFSSGGVSL